MAAETITKQEIFDVVATHLLQQGERSEGVDSGCLYRGPGGLKCAVGCLITDEEYNPRMDHPSLATDITSLADIDILPARLVQHIDFLDDLQRLHDLVEPQDWTQRLNGLAVFHKLDTSALQVEKTVDTDVESV